MFAVMGLLLGRCQGAGIVEWPASSSMLKDPHWIFNGVLMANFGLLQIYVARSR